MQIGKADLKTKMLLAQECLHQLADCVPLLYRKAGNATTVDHKEFGWKLAANAAGLDSKMKLINECKDQLAGHNPFPNKYT